MNWTVALEGVLVAIQVIGFAWLGGRKEERSRDNGARIREHDIWLNEHRVRLDGHDVELAKINAWREGYNAGCAKKVRNDD